MTKPNAGCARHDASKCRVVAAVKFTACCLLLVFVYLMIYGEDRPTCWNWDPDDGSGGDSSAADGRQEVGGRDGAIAASRRFRRQSISPFEDLLDDGWPNSTWSDGRSDNGTVDSGSGRNTSTARLFAEKPLVLLSIDYHASPIYDVMDLLQPFGVRFIQKGLNPYMCQHFNTCTTHQPLKVYSRPIYSV